MSSIKPRGKVPKKASIDEIIEIKTWCQKEMKVKREIKETYVGDEEKEWEEAAMTRFRA